MKKFIATAASLALASSFSIALPTAASAESGSEQAQLCKTWSDESDGAFNPGECTRYFRTEGAVQLCNYLKAFDLLEPFGYKNVGQCIKENS